MKTFEIKNLKVEVEGKMILKGVNLTVNPGEIHVIMGPNGTGKSTLSETIMGNPKYKILDGQILLDGESINDWPVDKRARHGLFLAMQYPVEIPGITNSEFIKATVKARQGKINILSFIQKLKQNAEFLDISEKMLDRNLNEGFSGGEKKRNEILQMMMIDPDLAILDEIDSGLDIDALQVVAKGVNQMRSSHFSTLMITHYQRLLNYIHPDVVHVMMDGRIVKSGDFSMAQKLEKTGYAKLRDELGLKIRLVDENV
ncbi:Fe-S cluster assembly ATPase SufC [Ligilactobacillus cholophilus]|uniref:Fe-S cluster assembly ATPase SufC n=1 Tax=Ligilactobacillus cholophilus TaxID=3050131 RepID=UPI0025B0023B|nr:Fe-S cluster assembly ATPase SufC [Ligilactobacillus cholophilus]